MFSNNWGLKLCLVFFVLSGIQTKADEGMWLPALLKGYNYAEMKRLGCKLTANQIYDINHSSLKDAIVQLGGFCTAELVSKDGLLFTNHNCAYEAISSISSTTNDYLTDGFWAKNRSDERYINGLTISFFIRMEDVTEQINKARQAADEGEKELAIAELISSIEEKAEENDTYRAVVKEMFDGNAHYLFVYQDYNDIRLVGAPPEAIGKFGGDTDNWKWPRHTGDFSVLRIYADNENKPAENNANNRPYKAKHFLPISIKGVEKGDFQMVMGYPASTSRYLTSYEIQNTLEHDNPIFIKLLQKRLSIMKEHMNESPEVKILFASNYATISNSCKYFIGQSQSLNHNNLIQTVKEQEEKFQTWANNKDRLDEYGFILSRIKQNQIQCREVDKTITYINYAGFAPSFTNTGLRLWRLHRYMERNAKDETQWQEQIDIVKNDLNELFSKYDKDTDKDLFAAMCALMLKDLIPANQPDIFTTKLYLKAKGKTLDEKCKSMADKIFKKSMIMNRSKLEAFLEKPSFKKLEKDLGLQYIISLINWFKNNQANHSKMSMELEVHKKTYVKGLMEMYQNRQFYPDANFTMRLTYGTVQPYSSWEGKPYQFKTFASEILMKENPNNAEFLVPAKLKQLIKNKDYGRYGKDGQLTVCYINNTDITGGNSGSPVIDANGNLTGIAFDGNWESMSSDLAFEDEYVRTIVVDAAYVLFIIDKFAGAGYLLNEMVIKE